MSYSTAPGEVFWQYPHILDVFAAALGFVLCKPEGDFAFGANSTLYTNPITFLGISISIFPFQKKFDVQPVIRYYIL